MSEKEKVLDGTGIAGFDRGCDVEFSTKDIVTMLNIIKDVAAGKKRAIILQASEDGPGVVERMSGRNFPAKVMPKRK